MQVAKQVSDPALYQLRVSGVAPWEVGTAEPTVHRALPIPSVLPASVFPTGEFVPILTDSFQIVSSFT